MKNKIIYLIVLTICCINCSFSQPSPGLRTIFWLHGFGGDQATWQKYYGPLSPFGGPSFHAGHFPFTYQTLNGIEQAAIDASSEMTFQGNTNEDFAICHSMGGLTIRKIERDYNQENVDINGYITVGTPNDG